MPDRIDLATQVSTANHDLLALARRIHALAEEYDRLDIPEGTADRAAVVEVIDALFDTNRALTAADTAIRSAVQNANSLAGDPGQHCLD
jgi:hypothetical protein